MIRIPNPGSDIDTFVRIFRELYAALAAAGEFGLDDMTRAMVAQRNVSSQGAFGEVALARSTRPDRSHDPLYNQSKMYSELYRTLGWQQSTTTSLRFVLSWMGAHIAQATDPKPLVKEHLLGIAYPNDVLKVKSTQSIRVFAAILRAMKAAEGMLSRDEMIIGPLSLSDDRDDEAFEKMLDLIESCRSGRVSIAATMSMTVGTNISPVTMGNYTRFPIAAIQWAGWAEKRGNTFVLTEQGQAKVAELQGMTDVRVSDYRTLPEIAKPALIRLAAYRQLERSGFDVSPVATQIEHDRDVLAQETPLRPGDVLFSPFQQLNLMTLRAAMDASDFGPTSTPVVAETGVHYEVAAPAKRTMPMTTVLAEVTTQLVATDSKLASLAQGIRDAVNRSGGSIDGAIDLLVQAYANSNKGIFYPLVANLFRLIGFNCEPSRPGVNYARADAMIIDPRASMPIEIKSPGEETEISVKAVRQALENKIVLLSRHTYPTTPETTTLVVGFNPPNERSEVHELVENIFTAYGVRVGIVDFRSLLRLACVAVISGRKLELNEFSTLKGLIDVDYLAPEE